MGLYDVDMISATEGWRLPIHHCDHANILPPPWRENLKQQGSLFSQLSGISFADRAAWVAVVTSIDVQLMAVKLAASNPVGGSYYDVDLVDQNTGYACGSAR